MKTHVRQRLPVGLMRLLAALMLVGAATVSAQGNGLANGAHFATIDGRQASLADFRGQVVVLNLWAVWCSPCIIEIPHLVRLQAELETHGATVIGLAVDSGSARAIRWFWTDRLEIEPVYPLWMTTVADAEALFGARTFPTTLIIDRQGRVRERLLGLQTRQDLEEAVAPYLHH